MWNGELSSFCGLFLVSTNWQGDVLVLFTADKTKVAEYEYDAWGNAIVYKTDENGSLVELSSTEEHIGNINPIRYRGYFYDVDMGLYYLMSRYYDASIGRFINADGLISTGQGSNGFNMFAYCGNNPVNRVDPTGCMARVLFIAIKRIIQTVEREVSKLNLKKNPTNLTNMGDNNLTYANESDESVIVRMLYGEDHKAMEGHMWVLENRRIAGNYGGDNFRDLILAEAQFSCMTEERSLNPKSQFEGYGEAIAWENCVDMAYLYTETYDMSAIEDPFDGAGYTWTQKYSKEFATNNPNGTWLDGSGTWFYHKW